MADDATAAEQPPAQHFETQYNVTTPEGGVMTRVLRSDRPVTNAELAQHAASHGYTFAGVPEPPPPAAPPGAPAPAAAPTLGQRAMHVLAPERTFASQTPSIAGGIAGGYGGATLGAATGPFAPVAVPLFSTIGAGLGSAAGEGLTIAGEKLGYNPPAEEASAWERLTNAGIRGATAEGVAQPLRIAAGMASRAIMPGARAAAELAPVLEQGAGSSTRQVLVQAADGSTRTITDLLANPGDIPGFVKGAPAAQDALLNSWWQRTAPQGAEEVVNSWQALGRAGQRALAGPDFDSMQTVVNTIKAGQRPINWTMAAPTGSTAATAAAMLGHPGLAPVLGAAPALASKAATFAPAVETSMLLSPTGSQWLAGLPGVMRVASPTSSFALRTGAQAGLAPLWPTASTLTPRD
jgi:hypothetical protein